MHFPLSGIPVKGKVFGIGVPLPFSFGQLPFPVLQSGLLHCVKHSDIHLRFLSGGNVNCISFKMVFIAAVHLLESVKP